MINKYVHIIDENGVRITSIVDNMLQPVGEKELIKQAKEQYPNAAKYIYGDDEMLDALMAGKIYKDGELVDAPLVEPTEAEVKKASIATIKQKYEEKFKSYEAALMRARLAGNDASVDKLQEVYKSDMAAMAAEIKGV